jgi:hypothetical protein
VRIVWLVAEPIEVLERRIDQLRVAVREAVLAGDKTRARTLRAELRQAERSWEDALAATEAEASAAEAEAESGADGEPSRGAADEGATDGRPRGTGHAAGTPAPSDGTPGRAPGGTPGEAAPLLPLREQVYEALSLLQVPAAPRLIATVHEAFFATTFSTTRVTRDEERSFRTAPFARPYYICAALTADFLSPSRGLLAVSTWPMEKRVIGSLSPRVDFLEAAIRVAEAIERIPAPVPAARRLLWRFAASIPGAAGDANHIQPDAVRQAAEAEVRVHKDADTRTRREAASRARRQLTDVEQLFGSRSLRPAGHAADEEA